MLGLTVSDIDFRDFSFSKSGAALIPSADMLTVFPSHGALFSEL
jgi:hypothetical protein